MRTHEMTHVYFHFDRCDVMSFQPVHNTPYPVNGTPNLVITQNPAYAQYDYNHFGQYTVGHVESPVEQPFQQVILTPVETMQLEPEILTEENEVRFCGLRTLSRAVIVGMILSLVAIAVQALVIFVYIPSLPDSIVHNLPSWFHLYMYSALAVHLAPFMGAISVLAGECFSRVGGAKCNAGHVQNQQQSCRTKPLCTIMVYFIASTTLLLFRVCDFILAIMLNPVWVQLVGAVCYMLAWVRVLMLIVQAYKLRDNSNKSLAANDGEIEMTQH